MTHYCLGFVYIGNRVLLIRKNLDCKLEFMRGKLNGIGGHVEDGETPLQAMIREFTEESGINKDFVEWKEKGMIFGNGYDVTIFRGNVLSTFNFYNKHSFPIKSNEGEIDQFYLEGPGWGEVVDNIPILLPLINTYNGYKYFLDYGVDVTGPGKEPIVWCEKE